MAERRMFAKTIIDSDAFLDMPLSTQALYFHLSMRADDEGFVNNPKKIQRMIGAADDDIKVLVGKKFIIPFDSGVVVIKHWKIHNYIRGDRLKGTVYQEEASRLEVKENGAYTLADESCLTTDCQVTDICLPNDSLGQDSIGQDSIGQESIGEGRRAQPIGYAGVVALYHTLCPSFPEVKAISEARKKAIKARLNSYSYEDFKTMFQKAEASSFLKGANDRNWTATFDWLMKDSNFAKVLDGNYDDRGRGSGRTSRAADDLQRSYEMIAQWAESEDE